MEAHIDNQICIFARLVPNLQLCSFSTPNLHLCIFGTPNLQLCTYGNQICNFAHLCSNHWSNLRLSVCLSVSACLFSVSLSLSPSHHHHHHLSQGGESVFVYLSVCLCVCLSIYPSVCLSVCLCTCLYIFVLMQKHLFTQINAHFLLVYDNPSFLTRSWV